MMSSFRKFENTLIVLRRFNDLILSVLHPNQLKIICFQQICNSPNILCDFTLFLNPAKALTRSLIHHD